MNNTHACKRAEEEWCVVSCLLCSVWHNTCISVVVGVLVVIVAGSRPVVSVSIPVAKPVGADGTAPGRVRESRLPPALITS